MASGNVNAESGMPSHVTLVITLVGQRVAIAAGGLGRHPSRVTGVPPGRYRLAYPSLVPAQPRRPRRPLLQRPKHGARGHVASPACAGRYQIA